MLNNLATRLNQFCRLILNYIHGPSEVLNFSVSGQGLESQTLQFLRLALEFQGKFSGNLFVRLNQPLIPVSYTHLTLPTKA